MNTVCLIGRLTFEPELKSTPSGISVTHLQVAVDRSYRPKGEDRKADFIDVTAWRQTAEFINRYFHKGDMIALEGSIQTESYTDRDGTKRKSVAVIANNVSFCGSKSESAPAGGNTHAATTQRTTPAQGYSNATPMDFEEIVDDDDLPF